MNGRLFAAFAGAVLFGTSSALLPLLPREGEAVAVVGLGLSGPGLLSRIAEADGQLIAMASPSVAIARSEHRDFVARLRSAGAWLVLDAEGVMGCLRAAGPLLTPRSPQVSGGTGTPVDPSASTPKASS